MAAPGSSSAPVGVNDPNGGNGGAARAEFKVGELQPNMRNVNCTVIILDKAPVQPTKEGGRLCHARVADETGLINLPLFDTYTELHQGDIVRLSGGRTGLFRDHLTLYVTKRGTLQRVGQFTLLFSEKPDMSAPTYKLDPKTKQLVPMHS